MVRLADRPDTLPAGARVVSRFGDIATVRVRRGALEQLRDAPRVRAGKASRSYRPELVRVAAEATPVTDGDRRRPDALEPTGRGVVIGVLDWGLDLGHPAFLRGRRSAVEALWD